MLIADRVVDVLQRAGERGVAKCGGQIDALGQLVGGKIVLLAPCQIDFGTAVGRFFTTSR